MPNGADYQSRPAAVSEMSRTWLCALLVCLLATFANQADESSWVVNGTLRRQRSVSHSLNQLTKGMKNALKGSNVGKYIDLGSQLLDHINSVADRIKDSSAGSNHLKEELKRLQKQLDGIQVNAKHMAILIKVEQFRTLFFPLEEIIEHCFRLLSDSIAPNGSANSLKQLLESAKDLEKKIFSLLDAIAGDRVMVGDVIRTLSDFSKCRTLRLKNDINELMALAARGLMINAIYRGMNNVSEQDNEELKYSVNTRFLIIRDMLEAEVTRCRTLGNVERTLVDILKENGDKHKEQVLDEAFSYLSERFDNQLWYVMAYHRSTKLNGDFQQPSKKAEMLFDPHFYSDSRGSPSEYSLAALPVLPSKNSKMTSQAPVLLETFCNGPIPSSWNIDYSTENVYAIYEQLIAYVNRHYRYVIIRPDAAPVIQQSPELNAFKLPASASNKCSKWKDFTIVALPSERPEDTLVPVGKLSLVNSNGTDLVVADHTKSLYAVQEPHQDPLTPLLVIKSQQKKQLWRFEGAKVKNENGHCLDVWPDERSILFKNELLSKKRYTLYLTSCDWKATQNWRREGTYIVGAFGCVSTSYQRDQKQDVDFQYPHLVPCGQLPTTTTYQQDWYFVDDKSNKLATMALPQQSKKHWSYVNDYGKVLSVKGNWIQQKRFNNEGVQLWKLTREGLLMNRHDKCLMTKNQKWASQENCNQVHYRSGLFWTYRNYQLQNVHGCLAVDGNEDGGWVVIKKCDRSNPSQLWYLSEDGVKKANLPAKQTSKLPKSLLSCPDAMAPMTSVDFIMQNGGKGQVKLKGYTNRGESHWIFENGQLHNGQCLCLVADAGKEIKAKPCGSPSPFKFWTRVGSHLRSADALCLQRYYNTSVSYTKFRLKLVPCDAKDREQTWKNFI